MPVKILRRGEHMLRILSIIITATLVMMITVKTLRRGEAARGEVSAPRLVTLHCPSHANTANTLLVLLVLSILSVFLILWILPILSSFWKVLVSPREHLAGCGHAPPSMARLARLARESRSSLPRKKMEEMRKGNTKTKIKLQRHKDKSTQTQRKRQKYRDTKQKKVKNKNTGPSSLQEAGHLHDYLLKNSCSRLPMLFSISERSKQWKEKLLGHVAKLISNF